MSSRSLDRARASLGATAGGWGAGVLIAALTLSISMGRQGSGAFQPGTAQASGVGPSQFLSLTAPSGNGAQGSRHHPGGDFQVDEFTVHVPAGATEPLTALVALHGMGGSGSDVTEAIRGDTDWRGWVVVAPTFDYGDWRDPAQLVREARRNLPRISSLLDQLPKITGLSVRPQALVYGFSRGGQEANRFALVYPERVAGVAILSSGTYTLPLMTFTADGAASPLRFPFGISDCTELFGRPFGGQDFANVPFWVGVGGSDADPADVPRQWDPYIGDDRLERAERFTDSMRTVGLNAQSHVFAGMGHGELREVRTAAIQFLASF